MAKVPLNATATPSVGLGQLNATVPFGITSVGGVAVGPVPVVGWSHT